MTPDELKQNYYLTCKHYVETNGETVDFEIMSRNEVFSFMRWDNIITEPTEAQLLAYSMNDVLGTIKMAELRTHRTKLLTESDYLAMPDYPINDADKALLVTYRTALRNLPATVVDLMNIVYPVL
jgi:hypothetical protein